MLPKERCYRIALHLGFGQQSLRMPPAKGVPGPRRLLTLLLALLVVIPALRADQAGTFFAGSSVTLSVSASGTGPFAYQWRKNGVPISGATGSTLALNPIQLTDAGTFSVVVSNSAGSTTSDAAVLSVDPAPVAPSITTQPVGQTILAGQSATFTVVANGTPTLTYQWRKNGLDIGGATQVSYAIPVSTTADSGGYSVVVSNSAGSTTSGSAALTVNPLPVAPSITTQPVAQTVNVGSNVVFSVVASGVPAPAYQWRKDGVNISGATSATLTLNNVQLGDSGGYSVRVSNSAGTVYSNNPQLTVNPLPVAPSITTQPQSQAAVVGNDVTFMVVATGSPAPTYQWRKYGAPISGATNSTFTLTNVQLTDAADYTVTVSNLAGTVTSSAANLVVTAAPVPPSIQTQPQSATVFQTQPATFTVVASGSPTLGYQWKKNGVPIPNAIGSSYTIASAQASDAASYTVTASNIAGSVTSSSAVLTVTPISLPVISAQPADKTVDEGDSASFAVVATGVPSPSYQWRRNGVDISGATSSSYSLGSADPADAGSYTVRVSNLAGSVTSNAATLTVNFAPQITAQPSSKTVATGATATFTVVATGLPAPTYQWRKGGVAISGATGSSYSITNASAGDQATYTVVVTNSLGSITSSGATLTVLDLPSITTQPASQSVGLGSPAMLSVVASGGGTLSYQWQRDGVTIGGATSSSLNVPAVTPSTTGAYTVIVSNSQGSVTSAAAILAVAPASQRNIWLMNGSSPVSEHDIGSFDPNWKIVATVSLNGDQYPDILWQNVSTGERYLWLMAGFTRFGDVDLGLLGPNWSIVAASDFNGDGQRDFIWQNNATGECYVWLLNGTDRYSDVNLGTVPLEQKMVAAVDFNGDGRCDLVWQNTTTGERFIWIMNGATPSSVISLGTVAVDWFIVAAADYNHDGNPDIYWENRVTGERLIWLMNGDAHFADVDLGIVDPAWGIATVADFDLDGQEDLIWEIYPVRTIGSDFNRDGMADVVWQQTATGERYLWLLHQTTHWGDSSLPPRGTDWQIAGSGDFNLDGRPDLVWQNTNTGQREIEFYEGSTPIGTFSLGTLSTDWKISVVGDFNADGKPDIVWQNTVAGYLYLWLMDGTNHFGDVDLGTQPTAEVAVGAADFNDDGFTDLVWQNTSTGNCHVWLLQRSTFLSDEPIGTAAASEVIATVADYDRDGKPDLLWQNTATGNRHFWIMNGLTQTSDVPFAVLPTAWSIAR